MTQIPVETGNLNIGRKKETRIYYRQAKDQEGNLVWIPTLPLPADPYHLQYYTKKGFKLWPPGKEPGQEEAIEAVKLDTSKGKISCPEPDCSFVARTYIGLSRHMSKKHGIK